MKKQRLISILLFFVLQIVIIVGLRLFMIQEEGNMFLERQQELKHQYTASIMAYRRLAALAFAQHFNTLEVNRIIKRAQLTAPADRNPLRRELYNRLLPAYTHLRKAGFRQIHFHFHDGTSFLRMHLPDQFGDQLRSIRPSINKIIKDGRPLHGYEIGRHWQAYRFLFPIHSDNQLIGSVEISIPFSTLLDNLMDIFPCQARFIVRRKMAVKHLDADALQRHYHTSSFSSDFLEERPDEQTTLSTIRLSDRERQLAAASLKINHLRLEMHEAELKKPVSFPLRIEGKIILTTMLPVTNINEKWAGTLIFHENFPFVDILLHRYLLGWFTVTVFSLIMLLLHDRYSRKIEESHAELDQIFNTAADGIRLIDLNGIIIRSNETFAEMVGMPVEKILGRLCYTVFPGSSCATNQCPMKLIKKGEQLIWEETEKNRADGNIITCLMMAKPFTNIEGKLIGIIEDFRDISDRKLLEQQLHALSITDDLTGLNNRRGFMTLAEQQLQDIKRSQGVAILLFADLDNMKAINDNMGHEAGDRTLQATARMLRATLREPDIIGRMGGDEFAVLMEMNSAMDSEKIILKRLNAALARVNRDRPPEQQIAISIGLVRAENDTTLKELLTLADNKMYAVKQQRKAGTK